jgi:L-phenylalanine/L-methionine N-acetyltransferase
MTITVRRAQIKDAAALARIMGDPAVYPGLMQLPFTDEELWRGRLTEILAPGKQDVMLCAELDGEVVGNSGMHPAGNSLRRRHAWSLGISVHPSAQGRGVGTALMQAMCDYADNWAAALRLELSVYTDNTTAIALYKKFGFVIEGTFKGYVLRHGVYVDAHTMARFHPNPPGIVAGA